MTSSIVGSRGKTLVVRPLGKVMFRGPGEFDMSSAGVKAYASSMPYPLPTTIVSIMIKTGFKKSLIRDNHPWGDWVGEYTRLMDQIGLGTPRGPFIKLYKNGLVGYYLPYDQKRRLLLGIGSRIEIPMKLRVGRLWNERPGQLLSPKNGEGGAPSMLEVARAIRELVGVNLEEGKTTGGGEEGKRVFTAEFLFPEALIPSDAGGSGNLVVMEYHYLIPDSSGGIQPLVSRIGGEGGMAYIEVSDGGFEMDLGRWEGEWLGLYVLSPVLIPTDNETISYLSSELSNTLNITMNRQDMYVVGETTLLSAGYAIRREVNRYGTRRPIYKALMPGSLIYIRNKKGRIEPNLTEKLIWEGIGMGREVGFGSIIPFNYEIEGGMEVLDTWSP